MKKLVKWTFCFEDRQLQELKELSKKSSIPQAVFVREALNYILKKYRYLLTMKTTKEQARYGLSRSRNVGMGEEELQKMVNLMKGVPTLKEEENGDD